MLSRALSYAADRGISSRPRNVGFYRGIKPLNSRAIRLSPSEFREIWRFSFEQLFSLKITPK